MAKKFYWLKMETDYLTSPKIKKLRKIAGGDTYTIIYLKMQLQSVKNGGVLEYSGLEPSFPEELALILDEDEDNVKITVNFLESMGLLVAGENGEFLLPEAAGKIGSESESAERVRKFRANKTLLCNTGVTSSNTEKEIDKEQDKDKEQEKKKIRRFTPPTLDEVKAYCSEINAKIDPEAFVDYYTQIGWVCGKAGKPMKDWKSAVRNWNRRESKNNKGAETNESGRDTTKYRLPTTAERYGWDDDEYDGLGET